MLAVGAGIICGFVALIGLGFAFEVLGREDVMPILACSAIFVASMLPLTVAKSEPCQCEKTKANQ
jgi:hypothetical protein